MPATYPFLTVAFYAGLNGLILLWLAVGVAMLRRSHAISIGDGGDPALMRAMRGQANFTEYVPYALLLMYLMAVIGTPAWVIHLMGLPLTLARIAHGAYFLRAEAPFVLRVASAAVTMLVIALASLGLIFHAAAQMLQIAG